MKYEDYLLLDFILCARKPVSSEEIFDHLQHSLEGYAQRQPKNGSKRNIQNRLKSLVDCEHFAKHIEVSWDGRTKLYKGKARSGGYNAEMSIEQACALLMSDKHLSALAPTRLFQSQSEYQELITRAEGAVKKHQQLRLQSNNHMADFMKRVAVVQRSQALVGAAVDNQVLECIATCIVNQRCMSLSYNGKRRVLHPFGLVFRQPKIYLLAVDIETLKKQGASKVRPRQFLCNRIEGAKVSRVAHQVPEDFDINDFVAKGRLEFLANAGSNVDNRSFTLKLRIYGAQSDNMVRDLQEYPLSKHQKIVAEPGTENCILTAPGMRATHSLIDWVMGRMDRVEVLNPKSLRNHVVEKIDAMQQRYR